MRLVSFDIFALSNHEWAFWISWTNFVLYCVKFILALSEVKDGFILDHIDLKLFYTRLWCVYVGVYYL